MASYPLFHQFSTPRAPMASNHPIGLPLTISSNSHDSFFPSYSNHPPSLSLPPSLILTPLPRPSDRSGEEMFPPSPVVWGYTSHGSLVAWTLIHKKAPAKDGKYPFMRTDDIEAVNPPPTISPATSLAPAAVSAPAPAPSRKPVSATPNQDLIQAAEMGDHEALQRALGDGADLEYVEAQDKKKMTALHWAAKCGRPADLSLLIEKRANIDARTKAGVTPLIYAASEGWDDCVPILLKHGASPGEKTAKGRTALQAAREKLEKVSELEEKARLEKVVQQLSSAGGEPSSLPAAGETVEVPKQAQPAVSSSTAVKGAAFFSAPPATVPISGSLSVSGGIQSFVPSFSAPFMPFSTITKPSITPSSTSFAPVFGDASSSSLLMTPSLSTPLCFGPPASELSKPSSLPASNFSCFPNSKATLPLSLPSVPDFSKTPSAAPATPCPSGTTPLPSSAMAAFSAAAIAPSPILATPSPASFVAVTPNVKSSAPAVSPLDSSSTAQHDVRAKPSGVRETDRHTLQFQKTLTSLGLQQEEHQALLLTVAPLLKKMGQLDLNCERYAGVLASHVGELGDAPVSSVLKECDETIQKCEEELPKLLAKKEGIVALLQLLQAARAQALEPAVQLLREDEPNVEQLHRLHLMPRLSDALARLRTRVRQIDHSVGLLHQRLQTPAARQHALRQSLRSHADMLSLEQQRVVELCSFASNRLRQLQEARMAPDFSCANDESARPPPPLRPPPSPPSVQPSQSRLDVLRRALLAREQPPPTPPLSRPDVRERGCDETPSHSSLQGEETHPFHRPLAQVSTPSQPPLTPSQPAESPAAVPTSQPDHPTPLVAATTPSPSPLVHCSAGCSFSFNPTLRATTSTTPSLTPCLSASPAAESTCPTPRETPTATLPPFPTIPAAPAVSYQTAPSPPHPFGGEKLASLPSPSLGIPSPAASSDPPPPSSSTPTPPTAEVAAKSSPFGAIAPAGGLDERKNTALHRASKGGEVEAVRRELAGGADVNACNKTGITPLIYAASEGRLEAVELLLQAGADRAIRTHKGRSALQAAQEKMGKAPAAEQPAFARIIQLLSSETADNTAPSPGVGSLFGTSAPPVPEGAKPPPLVSSAPPATSLPLSSPPLAPPTVAAAPTAADSSPASVFPPPPLPAGGGGVDPALTSGRKSSVRAGETLATSGLDEAESPTELRLKWYAVHRPASNAASVIFSRPPMAHGGQSPATSLPPPPPTSQSVPLSFGTSLTPAPALASPAAPPCNTSPSPQQPRDAFSFGTAFGELGGSMGGQKATSPFGAPAPASPFGSAPAISAHRPSAFGGGLTSSPMNAGANAFGAPAATAFGGSPFGAPAVAPAPSAPVFGAPAPASNIFGIAPAPTGFGVSPVAPAFGAASPTSTFGGATAPAFGSHSGGFGGGNTPAFGAPSALGGGVAFGQPSTLGRGSAFGNSSFQGAPSVAFGNASGGGGFGALAQGGGGGFGALAQGGGFGGCSVPSNTAFSNFRGG